MTQLRHHRRGAARPWLLTAFVFLVVAQVTTSTDTGQLTPTFEYPGDLYIGVFIDLHKSAVTSSRAGADALGGNPPGRRPSPPPANRTQCGPLNTAAVQQLWAAIWAADTLNNQTEADMPKIGLKVYDTCDSPVATLRHTMQFMRSTISDFPGACDKSETIPMIGAIGIGEPEALRPMLGLTQVYSVPLLLATPSAASGLPPQSNMMTTAPTMASLVQAVVSLLVELHWKTVYSISSSLTAIQDLSSSLVYRDITVVQSITLSYDGITLENLMTFLSAKRPKNTPRVIVAMLEPHEIDRIVEVLRGQHAEAAGANSAWIVASPSVDKEQIARWSSVLKWGFLVTPHSLFLHDFRSSFLGALAGLSRNGRPQAAIDAYLRAEYGCDGGRGGGEEDGAIAAEDYAASTRTPSPSGIPPSTAESPGRSCASLGVADLQSGYRQDASVPFVSKAVSALAAALRMVQIDHCRLGAECVQRDLFRRGGAVVFADVMAALMRLSFTVQGNEPMEVEGTRLKFTEDGKLVYKHFDVYVFNGSATPVQVGWYSDNVGLNLNAAWRQRSLNMRQRQTTLTDMEALQDPAAVTDPDSSRHPRVGDAERVTHDHDGDTPSYPSTSTSDERKSWVNLLHFNHTAFVGRGWATAVVILAGVGILMTAYIFVYVMVKICDRTLTGNQFLGILLLISVIFLYSTCMLFVLPPSEAICNWRLFLHSFSYALCYGVLLLKVMQLLSLVLLGLGGRLSHVNQAVTLFFIVGLQVALNVMWSVLMRPMFAVAEDGEPRCLTTDVDFIWMQSYVILVLGVTVAYAVYARKIRRNHNEGRWVLIAAVSGVPVWIAWPAVYLAAAEHYREPAVCAGLLVSATSVVCAVFIPKLRTLSRQARKAKHKDATSGSTSTNSTMTNGFSMHNMEAGHGNKSSLKSTFPSSLFAESLLRNPLYDFKDKRLGVILEKSEK